MNLGGPGWFNDVFELDCEFASLRKLTLKGFLFQQDVPLFTTNEKIMGKIKVKSPPGKSEKKKKKKKPKADERPFVFY